jgi:ELWxxDGT repeat protein
LWISDGTATGTVLLKDIVAGGSSSNPYSLTAVGDLVYFVAYDADGGTELWVTDGTADGTQRVEDINPGANGSFPHIMGILDVNGAPADLALSGTAVNENSAAGTLVGRLSADDPDGDSLTFRLTDDAGGRFALDGNRLVVAGALDFETATAHQVTVEVDDGAGGKISRSFTIDIRNLNDATPGDDTLPGTAGPDTIRGLAGDDVLRGLGGDDQLSGDRGHDILRGGRGNDRLLGGSGNDSLYGESGNDTLNGGSGADRLLGGSSRDTLLGGSGNDTLLGGSGNDSLAGQTGADLLRGEGGRDILNGGSGNDILLGGTGRDTLDGGSGKDTLTGGADADRFVFTGRFGQDVISDFRDGRDIIDLSGRGLTFRDLDTRSVNGGLDTLIVVGRNRILLEGFEAGDLRAHMFDFI